LVRSVVVSTDGTAALSGARDATLRLWRIFSSPNELVEWTQANRYLRELTCAERLQYRLEPLCTTADSSGG
jgi:WD40 repeat protein